MLNKGVRLPVGLVMTLLLVIVVFAPKASKANVRAQQRQDAS